ncbi:stalk domain-containing protein [Paenibacillus guangzhouensis]|uniref:stalk domain-containing protein n=1 Tax=Paenibacillus guangzhouensis TaxID=1473112 RepID=UPI001266C684|nr:stalk domain-containing protein [Paenibacillus guangzhouensis]
MRSSNSIYKTHSSPIRHTAPSLTFKPLIIAMIIFLFGTAIPVSASASEKGIHDALQFTQVESGNYYSIALRKDGSVWTWGRNLLGEIGIQETVTISETDGPVRLSLLSDIKHIATSGNGHNLAVKADGTVWTWGTAPLSDDYTIHSVLPQKVAGIANAVTVASGSDFGVALRQDGSVWSWQRELNKNDTNSVRKPAAVSGIADVVQIHVSNHQIYAVKRDGTVWSWNEPSLLSNSKIKTPTKPVLIKGLSNIRSVTTNEQALFALDKKGKVKTLDAKGKPTAVQPKLTVKEVRAASFYTLFLTTAGDVYSYGRTVTGKQGKVNGLPKIKSISAGTYHNQAISERGEVWGWGGNHFNSVGATAVSPDGMIYLPIKANMAVDIMIDGQVINSIFAPRVSANTVHIPITTITRALGAQFATNQDPSGTLSYTIAYEGRSITFRGGDSNILVGDQAIELPESVSSLTGAVAAPYQLFEKGLGLSIIWDAQLQQLRMNTQVQVN